MTSPSELIERAKHTLTLAIEDRQASDTVEMNVGDLAVILGLLISLSEATVPEVRCDGCGSAWTDSDLARERAANPRLLSCCPERKPLTIDQWRARAETTDLSSLRKGAEVPCPHAPTHDAGLCCGHPDDCTFVSPSNLSKEENDA